MNIIIVDDNQVFIDAVCFLLKSRSDVEVIGWANDVHQFLKLLEEKTPDLVLMDVFLPDINGLKAAEIARLNGFRPKFVGVTMSDDINIHATMAGLDFEAAILKNDFSRDFATALEKLSRGERFFPVLN